MKISMDTNSHESHLSPQEGERGGFQSFTPPSQMVKDDFHGNSLKFTQNLWLSVSVYLLLNIILQLWASPTADLDQSEQLILSQTLDWGYTSQPPLYTWLVYMAFLFTGPSLAALLLIKVVLFSIITGALLKIGQILQFSRQQYFITIAGIALIPQFIWESQRDLTHSTLVTALAAVSLLQLMRLKQQPITTRYLLLGALIGLGMLSKYNYSFFAFALLLAALATPGYRQLLLNWRTLAGLLIALIIFSPHAYWALNHMEIASESIQKLDINEAATAQGLLAPLFKAATFLAPFWLFAVFFLLWHRSKVTTFSPDRQLLIRLLLFVALIVMIFAVVVGTQSFKDRWYQPLLFFTPLLLASYLQPQLQGRLYVLFLSSALLLALLASLFLPGRVLLAEKIDKISRPNYPYAALSQTLKESLEYLPATIITEHRLAGGNLRLAFPDTLIISPDSYQVSPENLSKPILLICETGQCADPAFTQWSQQFIATFPTPADLTKVTAPYFYYPQNQHVFYSSRVEKR